MTIIHFRKYVKFASREKSLARKYFGAFHKKKLPLFGRYLMNLDYLHQKMLSFQRNAFLFSVSKKLFGKLIERRHYLSPFSIA